MAALVALLRELHKGSQSSTEFYAADESIVKISVLYGYLLALESSVYLFTRAVRQPAVAQAASVDPQGVLEPCLHRVRHPVADAALRQA
jgi:hypothetical protein